MYWAGAEGVCWGCVADTPQDQRQTAPRGQTDTCENNLRKSFAGGNNGTIQFGSHCIKLFQKHHGIWWPYRKEAPNTFWACVEKYSKHFCQYEHTNSIKYVHIIHWNYLTWTVHCSYENDNSMINICEVSTTIWPNQIDSSVEGRLIIQTGLTLHTQKCVMQLT